MSTENRDRVRRALREFRKFEGDGQGGTGALPIGDPASGAHNPPKSLLREALEPVALGLDTVNASVAASAASAAASAASAAESASSASDAQTAKTQAELAAISAGAPLFADTTAGLAGTVSGGIFLVSTAAGMRVFQNNARARRRSSAGWAKSCSTTLRHCSQALLPGSSRATSSAPAQRVSATKSRLLVRAISMSLRLVG
jgi:hypothetical protein